MIRRTCISKLIGRHTLFALWSCDFITALLSKRRYTKTAIAFAGFLSLAFHTVIKILQDSLILKFSVRLQEGRHESGLKLQTKSKIQQDVEAILPFDIFSSDVVCWSNWTIWQDVSHRELLQDFFGRRRGCQAQSP